MSRTLISMLESMPIFMPTFMKIPSKTLAKNVLMNAGLVNTSPVKTASRQICRESCHHSTPPPPPPPPRTHLPYHPLRLPHSERRCTRATLPQHRSCRRERGDSLIERCTAW